MIGDNRSGFANENEIIDYLNITKNFDNLNDNFKHFISFLFPQNLNGKIIKSYKYKGQVKPDLGIIIDETEKYVSVKKGSGNSVHQEQLAEFESFLNNCGVSNEIINYLKEFHYGDGSTDGNGGDRINACQWQAQNPQLITQINVALNTPKMLSASLDRFLFTGNIPDAPVVDIMYHGNIENGLWASREEIIGQLIPNRNHTSTIHFSNLTYQAWNRNLNHNPLTADRRHVMQLKWPTIINDFIDITEKRL